MPEFKIDERRDERVTIHSSCVVGDNKLRVESGHGDTVHIELSKWQTGIGNSYSTLHLTRDEASALMRMLVRHLSRMQLQWPVE